MNDSKFEFQMLNRLSTFMIDKEIKSNRKSLILNIFEVIAACSILNIANAGVRADGGVVRGR